MNQEQQLKKIYVFISFTISKDDKEAKNYEKKHSFCSFYYFSLTLQQRIELQSAVRSVVQKTQ
jgi:hypothetical protein